MCWLKRLFRRKPQAPVSATILYKWEPQPTARLNTASDLIGRQVGQKRNRAHIYRQPFGYPIRLCDWTAQDRNQIEFIGVACGLLGPAGSEVLIVALAWAETVKGAVICKHCRAMAKGERKSIGMFNPGHGKGAPLP